MDALQSSAKEASSLANRLEVIAATSQKMFDGDGLQLSIRQLPQALFDRNARRGRYLDESCYDLLASEARLTSFIAIAKGDVPVSHWFHLGRALTPVGRGSALISWSGSMFEYLMPALLMRSPANTMLSQTYEQIVLRQIEYGNERGIPWGISESAFNARDIDFTYQYEVLAFRDWDSSAASAKIWSSHHMPRLSLR